MDLAAPAPGLLHVWLRAHIGLCPCKGPGKRCENAVSKWILTEQGHQSSHNYRTWAYYEVVAFQWARVYICRNNFVVKRPAPMQFFTGRL